MHTRRQQAPRPPENPSLCVAARRTPSKQIRVAHTVGKYIESRYREIISHAKALETRRQQTLGYRRLLTGAIPSGVPLFARSSDALPLKYACARSPPQKNTFTRSGSGAVSKNSGYTAFRKSVFDARNAIECSRRGTRHI